MSSYKITRIYLENFKLIDRAIVDMKNEDIIVLDGPNGFGKTTIFDAIELVLTGKIERIENYNKQLGFNTLLFSKDNEKDTIIKIEFASNTDSFTFAKWYKSNKELQKRDRKPDNWNLLDTYELSDFNMNMEKANKIDHRIIYESLGINEEIESQYKLFYYIQQEENTHFLKMPGKKRMDAINHLFDTQEEKEEQEKIMSLRKVLMDEHSKVINDFEQSNKQLDLYKGMSSGEKYNEVVYKPLIKDGMEVEWDNKELKIDSREQKDKYITELVDIEDFVENQEEFTKALFNKGLNQIISNKSLLNNSIIAWNFLNSYEQISERYKRSKKLLELREILDKNKILENIKELNFSKIKEETNIKFEVTEVEQIQNNIISQQGNANELSKVVHQLNNTREQLLKQFEKVLSKTDDKNVECPFCGYDWSTFETLLEGIKSKKENLQKYYDKATDSLEIMVADLYKQHINKILKEIEEELNNEKFNIDKDFFQQLKKAISSEDKIKRFRDWCKNNDIDISSYVNKEFNQHITDIDSRIEALANYLLRCKMKVKDNYTETSDKFQRFEYLYKNIFKNQSEDIKKITKQALDEKKKYINYVFYRRNTTMIETEEKRNTRLKMIKNKLEEKSIELKKISDVYDSEIRKHWNKIMKDIEIPFYIYSGKIIQEYQKGLGIFIEEAPDGEAKTIKFVSDNEYDHDAINYLSSGQLSALVISFTLALNKVYGNDSLDIILIDDPVQTMDEINMASLTELLRNEFSHKQIIISTHEEDVSRYLRYKFKKYDLKAMKFNVKENLYLPSN